MKERNYSIDIAKALGIFIVVLGHVIQDQTAHAYIYGFHMPLFFMLAGYTYRYTEGHNYTTKELIKKKFKTILVPYYIFLTLSFIYWITIERSFRSSQDGSVKWNIINIFAGFAKREWYSSNIAMWFLPCLFVTILLFYLIRKISNKECIVLCCMILCSIIGFSLCSRNGLILPLGCEIALIALFFVEIGYILDHKGLLIQTNTIPSLCAMVVCSAIYILVVRQNGDVSMLTHKYNMHILYVFGALSGSIALLIVSKCLAQLATKCRFITLVTHIGKNTLGIMVIHEPIKRVVIKLFAILTRIQVDTIRTNIVLSIVITIVTIGIIIPILQLIKKFVPQALGEYKQKMNDYSDTK